MNVRTGIAKATAVSIASTLVGLAGPATPAQAAGTCSLVIPSKVRVSTHYQAVTGRLGTDCAASGTDWAAWDAYHPTRGFESTLFFDTGATSKIWDVYDWSTLPGKYTWRPSNAYDVNADPVSQNQPVTDVRLGSGAAISTSRSGSYVTIKTSSSRYAYSTSSWVRWGGITGTIQYWGTSGWTPMKNAYQNSTGYYTYKVYAPKARSYRVVFPDTASIWGSVSASSYR